MKLPLAGSAMGARPEEEAALQLVRVLHLHVEREGYNPSEGTVRWNAEYDVARAGYRVQVEWHRPEQIAFVPAEPHRPLRIGEAEVTAGWREVPERAVTFALVGYLYQSADGSCYVETGSGEVEATGSERPLGPRPPSPAEVVVLENPDHAEVVVLENPDHAKGWAARLKL